MKRGSIAFFIPHRGCPHRCSFCDQRAISGSTGVTPGAVEEQLQAAFALPQDPATEIAFFGGSFTCLPEEEMTAFLKAAFPYVREGRAAGIRCSTRPDGISPRVLELFRAYGGRAVELGAQSMDDGVLALNGRGHTAADVERASSLVRSAGFSLGLQMMVGLPGEGPAGPLETARRLAGLEPRTLRIYPALVMRGTQMAQWLEEDRYRPLTLDEAVERCAPLLPFFEQRGIRVIRMGLHPEPSLEENLLAGPYHPAFRELCESRLFREEVDGALTGCLRGSRLALWVAPKDRSRAVGQKRQNLSHWAEMGYEVALFEDSTLPRGRWRLTPFEEIQ